MRRLLLALLAACTSSPSPEKLAVTPETANVLTCSTAQLAVTPDDPVRWSASAGTIDETGLYTSPDVTPDPATATITASTTSGDRQSASAELTLATAFPHAPVTLAAAPGNSGALGTVGVYQHAVVAQGTHAYAVFPSNPAGASHVALELAHSTDGGATFAPAMTAIAADLKPGTDTSQSWIECGAVAVDAGDPNVVYATARISGANSLGAAVGAPDQPVLVFAVSTDGGATFAHSVLHADTPIGFCADLASPAPNTVVIVDPVDICGKDVWVWSDANRGAGFATGTAGTQSYLAHGTTTALDAADGRACSATGKVNIEQNGTTALGGEATEAPRLFTDGAHHMCISYVGDTTVTAGPTPIHTFVQCSEDFGKTFGAPIALDAGAAFGLDHSHANGAFGPSGAVAVAWVRAHNASNQAADLFVATSGNFGRNWSAAAQIATYKLPGASVGAPVVNPTVQYDADGILWLAYRVDDGGVADRIVVDKSCDGGMTWSGPVLVNGTEQQIVDATFTNMKWPVLIEGSAAPRIAASASDHVAVFDLAP